MNAYSAGKRVRARFRNVRDSDEFVGSTSASASLSFWVNFQLRAVDLFRNLVLLGLLWWMYTSVRQATSGDLVTALRHASEVSEFQSSLGLPSELWLQRGFLGRINLVKAANMYYVGAHFPVTIGFLVWAWAWRRDKFNRIRNTLIVVTVVALGVHLLYPLAPPRMIPHFVDTGATFGPNPYSLSLASSANQIAAMPSMHVGWALIVAIGVIWTVRSPFRWLALLHPAVTLWVVVITANHFWVDALVAILLVGGAWTIASVKEVRRRPMGR